MNKEQSSGWVSGNQPPNNNRLVVVEGGVAKWDGEKWISETSTGAGRPIQWTVHWWTELPTPPQPPKPAAEVAFYKWYSGEGYRETNSAPIHDLPIWLAAVAWAKENKGAL